MRFPVPRPVQTALSLLTGAGYQACLVGGCVRDDVLGIRPHDYDVTTNATPAQIKVVFSAFPLVLAGEKHGTVTPVINGTTVEITTFRVDGCYEDGRHPDSVSFTPDLTADLARRDFTINAMACLPDGTLIDPFGGRADCAAGVIRCVGEPQKRLTEDALRILRGLRFSARFGFDVDGPTADALRALSARLSLISRERIAAELTGLLTGAYAARTLRAFPTVLTAAVPELTPMLSCPQHSVYHVWDVFEHTLRVLDAIEDRTPLRAFSALLHDCGKPAARQRDSRGFDHFPMHQALGAQIGENILRSLKLPSRLIEDVKLLILHHDDDISVKTTRQMLCFVGPRLFDDLLALKRADLMAHAPFVAARAEALGQVALEKKRVLDEGLCYHLKNLAVGGGEMAALGFRGREIGAELEKLLGMVLDDALPNERAALQKQAEADFPAHTPRN